MKTVFNLFRRKSKRRSQLIWMLKNRHFNWCMFHQDVNLRQLELEHHLFLVHVHLDFNFHKESIHLSLCNFQFWTFRLTSSNLPFIQFSIKPISRNDSLNLILSKLYLNILMVSFWRCTSTKPSKSLELVLVSLNFTNLF